jgi:hypothetical protein
MPTVRCPSCNRALKLPEAVDVATAQCPLCGTTFAAAEHIQPPPRPAPQGAPAAPLRRRAAEPDVSSPFDFEREADPLDRDDRLALASAASWLKAAGITGLLHSLLCWCGTLGPAGDAHEILFIGYCLGYPIHLIVSLLVFNGARALTSRRSLGSARLAVVMTYLAVVLQVFFALPGFLTLLDSLTSPRGRLSGGHEPFIVLMLIVQLLVIALFLTAGVKTMLALNRPGVQQAFRR